MVFYNFSAFSAAAQLCDSIGLAWQFELLPKFQTFKNFKASPRNRSNFETVWASSFKASFLKHHHYQQTGWLSFVFTLRCSRLWKVEQREGSKGSRAWKKVASNWNVAVMEQLTAFSECNSSEIRVPRHSKVHSKVHSKNLFRFLSSCCNPLYLFKLSYY